MADLSKLSTKELQEELARRNKNNPNRQRRYEITGTWSGYTSSQSRVCYRDYTSDSNYAKEVDKLGYIVFSDNTKLYLTVRELEYRERKQSKMGTYTSCIKKCVANKTHKITD